MNSSFCSTSRVAALEVFDFPHHGVQLVIVAISTVR